MLRCKHTLAVNSYIPFSQCKQDAALLGIQLSFGIAVPPSRTATGYVARLLEG